LFALKKANHLKKQEKTMKNIAVAALSCTALMSAVLPTLVQADEHKLDMTFRTHFGQVDRDFAPSSEEMSQALRLDYTSPYYNDVIGVDGSLYAIFKLHSDGNTAGIPLLDENGDGFTKIGQANVKLKLNDDSELRIGRMRIVSPLMTDTDGRSEPSTRQAIKATTAIGGVNLYAIYSDKVSTSGVDTFENYTAGGDGVAIIGGRYRFGNGLGIHLSHGQLKDAKQQTFINANYSMPVGDTKLSFDAYHYMAQDIGDKSNLADDIGADGKLDTSLSNLAVSLNSGDLTYIVSYQTVGDDLYEPSWDGFANDKSVLWTWNSVQILDFYNANEDSLQFRVDYEPSSVPGLSFMARYTEGDTKANGFEDKEFDLEAQYTIQSGAAKGLNLKLRYADVEIAGPGKLQDIRLIAQYKMNIF